LEWPYIPALAFDLQRDFGEWPFIRNDFSRFGP